MNPAEREHYESLESRPVGRNGTNWHWVTQQSFLHQQGGNFKWLQSTGGIKSYYNQINTTPSNVSSRVESNTSSVIGNVNANNIQNQTVQSINFVAGTPNFGAGATNVINGIAAGARPTNVTTMGPVSKPVSSAPNTNWSDDGLVKTVTEASSTSQSFTQVQTNSTINISFSTDLSGSPWAQNLINQRYNSIRNQLISQGVPAANISQGPTQWNKTGLGASGNQTIFNTNTTTTTTNGTSTTATTKTTSTTY